MPKAKYNDETLNVRLPQKLAEDARKKAASEKRPLSEVIRQLLRVWVSDKAK